MLEAAQENCVDERPIVAEPRPARSGKTAETLTVSLCDTTEAFRDLQDEWNHLLDRAARKSAFLRHEFIFAWWEVYGRQQRGATPFILTARDRERRLVGLLPFYRVKSRGIRELRFFGSELEAPEYLDLIVADGAQTDGIAKAVLAGLADLRKKYDLLGLIDLVEDALLLAYLPDWAKARGGSFRQTPWMICPHLKISGDFETYLQTLSTKQAGNFRRGLRKLQESHAVTMDVAIAPAQVEKDFAALCELHHQRWAERNETSTFDNETSRVFHRRVVAAMAKNGLVRIFTLKCDGRSVAALYCFDYDNRLMYYQAGFDVDYEKKSVGLILIGMVLQHCFAQGYDEFDFLRGEEEYKFRWTKTTRATMAVEIAVNGRAKIYLSGLQALRRLKKRVRGFLSRMNHAAAKK